MSAVERGIRALLAGAPIVPVYSPESPEEAVAVARALVRGGLPVIEVTLRGPRSLDALRAVVDAVPSAIAGAGTVLGPAQLDAVIATGARFAVSPGATPDLLSHAIDTGFPFLPGVATASELMRGLDAGLDCFKLFPAVSVGGPALLASLHGPFPGARFCPTGGITPATAPDYLRLPNVITLGGSWLTPRAALQAADWAAVEALARAAVAIARASASTA